MRALLCHRRTRYYVGEAVAQRCGVEGSIMVCDEIPRYEMSRFNVAVKQHQRRVIFREE